jgi:hypothetical protein
MKSPLLFIAIKHTPWLADISLASWHSSKISRPRSWGCYSDAIGSGHLKEQQVLENPKALLNLDRPLLMLAEKLAPRVYQDFEHFPCLSISVLSAISLQEVLAWPWPELRFESCVQCVELWARCKQDVRHRPPAYFWLCSLQERWNRWV